MGIPPPAVGDPRGTFLGRRCAGGRARRGADVRRSRLRPAGEVRAQRAGAGARGTRPWTARSRGWPGRARRHGVPGGEADRPARRRPRGPGLRAARPAADARPRAALHRPDRPARRAPRLAADRLARTGRRRVLPGHGGRAPGRRTPSGAAVRRADGGRRGGRAARRRGRDRPADRRRGRPDGAAVPRPRPVDALDRGHHPGRAGQGDPGAGQGVVVAISGGPGTGKTVVALHRAAFLLYSDRRRYETGGVLVVGPSGVFMRYIERVLPSLGETAVALRSLGEVVGGLRATRHDAPGGRGRQGLGPDGRADAAYVAPAGAGLAQGVPGVLARRRDPARPRSAREAAPPADGPGPAQPPAPADRVVAARRDVAAGARRARPRPRPRGVRRRHALLRRLRGVRAVVVAGARRHRGARLAARPGVPGAGRRGPGDRRGAAAAGRLLAGRLAVRGGRPARRRAALRARRRARPTRRGPRARRLPRRRPRRAAARS